MCASCDAWSCDECRLHVGDGHDVMALVQRLLASGGGGSGGGTGRVAVFLDFDRTVCSTKHGTSPLTGSHSADEELLELLRNSAGVRSMIVTRNSHGDDIAAWLAERGVADARERVRCVGRKAGTSKADVMLGDGPAALRPGEQGVFVDDDIREHADARLRQCESLHRVLFTRS